jgi:hypothetical protein
MTRSAMGRHRSAATSASPVSGGDLDGGDGFDGFTTSNGEGGSLIAASHRPSALSGVEANALSGAKSFIAKLGIANLRSSNRNEELNGDSVSNELVMRDEDAAKGFGWSWRRASDGLG